MSRRLATPRRSPLHGSTTRRALRAALLAGAALAGGASRARAQASVVVQGVADAEFWKTDARSILLTRNDGRPGALARVHLWGAAELGSRLVVYAAGTAEGGPVRAEEDEPLDWYVDMAGVRYTRSEALVVDAGKMTHPVGTFASRRYSSRNPLIGVPDGYPVQYPLGVQLSGARGRVDWRAAVVSLPVSHEGYLPEPGAAPRPALGAGYTPTTGVRIGASTTWGPYLSDEVPASLLAGRSWRAYRQRVGALDAQVSRGYLELRGELAAADYAVPGDVPGASRTVHGLTYYAEGRYTLTPRLFVAARLERNDYAFVAPASDRAWIATPTDMHNGELGAGWRLDARTLLKASVRADRWDVAPALRATLGDGGAFAVQLSRTFDVFDASVGGRR